MTRTVSSPSFPPSSLLPFLHHSSFLSVASSSACVPPSPILLPLLLLLDLLADRRFSAATTSLPRPARKPQPTHMALERVGAVFDAVRSRAEGAAAMVSPRARTVLALGAAFWLTRRLWRRLHTARLTGALVVITGASQGIGAALAYQLASLGARVVLLARGGRALEKVASHINAEFPGRAAYFVCDCSDFDAVNQTAKLIVDGAWGRGGRSGAKGRRSEGAKERE